MTQLLQKPDPGCNNNDPAPEMLRDFDIYKLVQELYYMNPKLIKPAYPVLATRLKSLDSNERLICLNVVTEILILDKATKAHPLFHPFADRYVRIQFSRC